MKSALKELDCSGPWNEQFPNKLKLMPGTVFKRTEHPEQLDDPPFAEHLDDLLLTEQLDNPPFNEHLDDPLFAKHLDDLLLAEQLDDPQ